jgi:hypothetical protein
MPRQWTPEQRAAFGEKMKAKRDAKRANGHSVEVELNPIATDVIKPTVGPRKLKLPKLPTPEAPLPDRHYTTELIRELEAVPLDSINYADCGLLLNALNVCSTAVALARRSKQEQLEAGTHRMPCKTCGRMIDISKAGGFQILTERDQFHMPTNSYFCSQGCVLQRNMPSHQRQTPKEKRENQA